MKPLNALLVVVAVFDFSAYKYDNELKQKV